MSKSLSQLLSRAGRLQEKYPTPPHVCHAVILLNREHTTASATDAIGQAAWCNSKRFILTPEGRVCWFCWTPKESRM